MSLIEANRFRVVVMKHLQALERDLKDFQQTTHGIIGGGDLDGVSELLVEAFYKPDAHSISNLSQSIRRFAERYPALATNIGDEIKE